MLHVLCAEKLAWHTTGCMRPQSCASPLFSHGHKPIELARPTAARRTCQLTRRPATPSAWTHPTRCARLRSLASTMHTPPRAGMHRPAAGVRRSPSRAVASGADSRAPAPAWYRLPCSSIRTCIHACTHTCVGWVHPTSCPAQYEVQDIQGDASLFDALGVGLGRHEMVDVALAAKALGQDPRRGVATVRCGAACPWGRAWRAPRAPRRRGWQAAHPCWDEAVHISCHACAAHARAGTLPLHSPCTITFQLLWQVPRHAWGLLRV